eukprot:7307658-Ditylum_brightwellii.AAC.1
MSVGSLAQSRQGWSGWSRRCRSGPTAEWQYLQRTVPGVGPHMAPIEKALAEDFFPALFGELDPGEGKKMRELWGHSAKRAGLGIPVPMVHAEHCHNTSIECCSVLVESILGKEAL